MISAAVGIIGYLTYRLVIFDYWCNYSVNSTLKKYSIKKTQFQIIKEFYDNKGETISEKKVSQLAKQYRQKEPEQFLAMYDSVRDKLEK
jgi:DNA-binding MarR family transcriptional regulator